MEDKDLFKAWKGVDQVERTVLKENQGNYEKLAQSKSDDIFNKIKKNIYWEVGLGILFLICLGFYIFKFDGAVIGIISFVTLLGIILSFRPYVIYLRDIKQINEASVVQSLEKKIVVLSRYVKQLNVYILLGFGLGLIIGFGAGMFESYQEVGFNSKLTVIKLAVLIPISLIFIWLAKKYVYALYGKHPDSTKEIYQNLIEKHDQ